MTAREYLASGQPDEALLELQSEIRARPEDPKLRIFLFQLHCVLGNWPKALIQLQVIAGIDPDTMLLAQIFQPVINCEALRGGIFADQRMCGEAVEANRIEAVQAPRAAERRLWTPACCTSMARAK